MTGHSMAVGQEAMNRPATLGPLTWLSESRKHAIALVCMSEVLGSVNAAHEGLVEPLRLKDVAYGSHPRQVLDFYQAKLDHPSPVVFCIHGGGWQNGDKKTNPNAYLKKGISVVAINYRYVKNGVEEKIEPPVKAPLEDAARELQFVRSKASEFLTDQLLK
ncbi:MAG: hypothetical protein ABGX16_12095 [Pirellulales bacterium]